MYAQSVIQQRLIKAKAELGFAPQYHSIAACRQWVDHLDTLIDDDGNFDRKQRPNGLNPDEKRWVVNEQKLCQIDYHYCSTRYFKLIDEAKNVVLCKPRIPQSMVLTLWADHEEKGWPIELIVGKARQVGITTICTTGVAHRVFFWPYTYAVIGSSDPAKSLEMSMMLEFIYDNLPWWLAPARTKYQSGSLMEFKGINTRLSVQHGSKFTGIARGSTPNVYHMTEVADFENAEELIDASLMRAVHPHPLVLGFLESTANGYGNWWYNSWKQARANWPRGRSRLRPIFLPWYTGRDIYPTATWIAQHRGLLATWEPSVAALRHKERAERYVHRESPILRQLLGANWRMPPEQLLWWEITREEHYNKRILHTFLQEACGDEMEMFQSQSSSVFTVEEMEAFEKRIRQPKATYGITGTDIERKFNPDTREVIGQGFTINYRWHPLYPGTYRFLPLNWRGYDEEGEGWQGKLLVWEYPIPGEQYVIGCDTSYGTGQDRSVIEVIRRGSAYRYDEQVAEFATPFISAEELWPFCMAIGTWYSQGSSQARYPVQCRQVIEVNAIGRVTQFELKKRGWNSFHPWLHIDRKKLKPSQYVIEGWYTNQRTRHELMVTTIPAVKNQSLIINSRYLVEEMKFLQKEEDDAYISSLHGQHDDRWMAVGFAYTSTHQLEVQQGQKRALPTPDDFLAQLPTLASTTQGPRLPSMTQRLDYDTWLNNTLGLGQSGRY